MGKHRFSPQTQRFAAVPHQPCIYAAELSTGVIKVGAASSARGRLMALANEVRRTMGADLGRFHVVPKLTPKAAYEAETSLVQAVEQIAEPLQGRREFFAGVPFEVVCQLADAAVCTPYRQPYRYERKTMRPYQRKVA